MTEKYNQAGLELANRQDNLRTEKLAALCAEQITKPLLPSDIATSTEKLLSAMNLHPKVHALHNKAVQYLKNPHTDEKIEELFWQYKGALFQRVSYEAFNSIFRNEKLILFSEHATNHFEGYLSRKNARKFSFSNAITDYSLDGLVIENEGTISHVKYGVEYTLNHLTNRGKRTKISEYAQKKIRQWEKQQKEFPNVFGEAKLLFIVPNETRIPEEFSETIEVEEMPFTREEFHVWSLDRMYNYRRVNPKTLVTTLTLKELQERAREAYNTNPNKSITEDLYYEYYETPTQNQKYCQLDVPLNLE